VETAFDGTAIFVISDVVGDLLPWLILLAALGRQLSAIVNATMSRSDMLVSLRVPRRLTFALLVVPAVVIFIMADIAQAVSLASRVFAIYYLLQAAIAGILAWRRQSWGAVAGFCAVGTAMATIAVFSLPLARERYPPMSAAYSAFANIASAMPTAVKAWSEPMRPSR
jgi:MFS-type transporter involved in bile tolerance (Atg22 family)